MIACDGSFNGIIMPFLHIVCSLHNTLSPSTHFVHPSEGSSLGSTHVVS